MSDKVCPQCTSAINKKYPFCPWCGHKQLVKQKKDKVRYYNSGDKK